MVLLFYLLRPRLEAQRVHLNAGLASLPVTENVRKSELKPELRKSFEESCARQNTVKWKTYLPFDAEFVRGMPGWSTFPLSDVRKMT